MSLANLGMALLIKAFTDFATGDGRIPLATIAGIAGLVVLAEGGLRVMISLTVRLASGRMECRLRLSMMDAAVHGKLLSVQKLHTGEILTRLTKDAEQVASCLPNLINTVLGDFLMALVALIYMFSVSWKLSVAVLAVVPLTFAIIGFFSPRLQRRARVDKENETANRAQMQDALGSIALIQSYGVQKMILQKVEETYGRKYRSTRALGVLEGIFAFLNNTAGNVMFLVVMGFGAFLCQSGELTVGGMISMVQILNYIVMPFANLSGAISQISQAVVSADRMTEVIDLPRGPVGAPAGRVLPVDGMTVEQVEFAYGPGAPVLQGVNARFQVGEIVGIFGPSGSGKSTLLRLLLGLYEPDRGEVWLSACDSGAGRRLRGAEMEGYMSYVPSDNLIYPGTIRENICFGAEPDEVRLWECAEIANIAGEIRALERQMETQIGDGGVQLSSGQRQRVAIARALYRKAQVLILDEPTSNLDASSIALLQATLRQAAGTRAVILVTHETSMAGICDRRYFLEDGTLREAAL